MLGQWAPLVVLRAAAAEDYFRPSVASGFPVQVVDTSTREQHEAVAAVANSVLPTRLFFDSLRANQELCDLSGIMGIRSRDLQQGLRPPAETVAAWVRNSGTVRNAAGACPQAAMLMLLIHVQNVVKVADSTDLQEASRIHLQYQCIKEWLLHEVFAEAPWQRVLANWPIIELEADIFRAYQRLLASTYNEVFDTSTPPGTGSALSAEQEQASEFYRACPEASTAAFIRVFAGRSSKEVVEAPVPFSMEMIGNELSLYWQARGLAILAGAEFRAIGGLAGEHFVRHLPRSSHTAAANATALRNSCAACPKPSHWRWPHLCLGAWARIQGTVSSGLQAALRVSGAEAAAHSVLRPGDVVVHFRCLSYFSDEYPLAAFSLFSALPAAAARILLVAGGLGSVCTTVASALEANLMRRFPWVEVVRRVNMTTRHGTITEREALAEAAELDFAILAFAPMLVRGPSSFSLWAALANTGRAVLSVANPLGSSWEWETADFGWVWVRTPLLTSAVAERHGFVFEQPQPWIDWLENH